ncbi:MAG TPA: DUF1402 family protein [Bauldia sp.]|nr:DUF1402 family protein [Bauldia sp.]
MKLVRSTLYALAVAALAVGTVAASAATSVIVVPPGNYSKTQPPIYWGSRVLTSMSKIKSFSGKYQRVYALLSSDKKLMANIKKSAAIYGIDPIHIIGAIVGEHTYNIDTYDTLQAYYVKALIYADNKSLQFEYNGQTAAELFKKPQFAPCNAIKSNYEMWDCREVVWTNKFFGKFVDGRLYPRDRLHRVFFKPMFAGQTFGIGQISPVAALMVTDMVHAKGGLPLLDMNNAADIYEQIMNPDTSIQYVAAVIRASIDMYKKYAGYDISKNPGLTATLYNLGDAATRARQLAATNAQRQKAGQPPLPPQENFYGWFINDKEAELRKLLS